MILLTSCASYEGSLSYEKLDEISYIEVEYDKQRSKADLYRPVGEGPFPGVIVVHGGGWSSRTKSDMDSVAESLASNGFVVMNINYRLAPEHAHPAPIDDLELALSYFKSRAKELKLDTKRIGLWGYSSGGHTVSLFALTRQKVQAVVSGGAPYDLTWYPKSPYVKDYTGFYRDQAFQTYIDASPITHIKKDAPPFFLYHALNDNLVEHAQAANFEAKLMMNKSPVKRYDIGFWGHGFGFAFSSEAIKEGVHFLKQTLK